MTGCDNVTSKYATIQDARNDKLFERGWLPDILPASSRNIRTSNDLDLNTSEGEFFFSPTDAQAFTSQLRLVGNASVNTSQKSYECVGSDSTWTFICKMTERFCSYQLRSKPRAYNN